MYTPLPVCPPSDLALTVTRPSRGEQRAAGDRYRLVVTGLGLGVGQAGVESGLQERAMWAPWRRKTVKV